MNELIYTYCLVAMIGIYFLFQVATRRFDPFAPVWLFFVGYMQIYVVQAISYHDWAVSVRGPALVAAANERALWALAWFLAIYHIAPTRMLASLLPRPPLTWSSSYVTVLSPLLVVWGLFCAAVTFRGDASSLSGEASLLSNFPFVMMVAAVLLIVTGRTIREPRPAFLPAGLLVAGVYILIWMFNGKRSHSLIAVLSTLCAMYITRLRRPSWSVLATTAFIGVLVVALAIGWRNDRDHERSFSGFVGFIADFDASQMLRSLNVSDADEEVLTYESEEYGGFLLMMDTVPEKSGYDHGANYLRVFSTFIPRLIWPSKPIYGRDAWTRAWIAGSELPREDDFTGPAIGLLGATQLNGGAIGTLIVVGCVALVLRTLYEFLRMYQDVPWVQFWWAISFYNAWFVVVCDDPLVWFYYNWGFTTFPIVVLTWLVNRIAAPAEAAPAFPGSLAAAGHAG